MTNQTVQTVQFNDQVAKSSVRKPQMVPKNLNDATESRRHDLQDFLKRPRLIDHVSVTSANGVGTVLGTYDFPDSFFTTAMNTCKCANFRYFRATAVLRFNLTTNPFSIGRLIAVALPCPTLVGANNNAINLTAMTGYNHCFIDLGTQPVVEFRIPYVMRKSAYDFINDTDPWLSVELLVFNPYNSTSGSSTCSVNVYAWAEDIQLDIPTRNDLQPFTPDFRKPRSNIGNYVGHMQSEADEVTETNNISGSIKSAGNLAKTVASGIGKGPVQDLGNAIGWVGDIAADALSIFGLSKNRNQQLNQPMTILPSKGFTNYNGDDNGVTLAYNALNSIDVDLPLTGSSVDEMDLKYVCSKPTYIETVMWPESAPVGTILSSFPVTPGFSAPGSAATNIAPTLLSYVSSMFDFWRGDLCYKLSIVANKYYSGRLCLAFFSGLFTLTSPLTLDDYETVYHIVIDIKDSTEVTFRVPYAVSAPYLRVRCASRSSTGTQFTYNSLLNDDVTAGLVALFVLNPLVSPDTVPSSIYLNLFSYCGENFELAKPSIPRYVPLHTVTTPSVLKRIEEAKRNSKKSPSKVKMYGHMNAVPENLNLDAGKPVSDNYLLQKKSRASDLDFAKTSIGEKVVNLRTLTRCYSIVESLSLNNDEGVVVDSAWFGWDNDTVLTCRLWYLARIYAFYRGSQRFMFIPQLTDPDTPFAAKQLWTVKSDSQATAASSPPSADTTFLPYTTNVGFEHVVDVAVTPTVQVTLPMYYRDLFGVITNNANTDREVCSLRPSFTSTTTVDVYVAGGDDFTFAYLIGPPLLTLFQ